MSDRIDNLVKQFDGAIKYAPMIKDHPTWTDEQCLKFAKAWHAVALEGILANDPKWNNGIPYCRNDVSKVKV